MKYPKTNKHYLDLHQKSMFNVIADFFMEHDMPISLISSEEFIL